MSSDQEFPRENGDDIETTTTETTSLFSFKREQRILKQKITALAQHRSRCFLWAGLWGQPSLFYIKFNSTV